MKRTLGFRSVSKTLGNTQNATKKAIFFKKPLKKGSSTSHGIIIMRQFTSVIRLTMSAITSEVAWTSGERAIIDQSR
jgi:hypothetical protein